VDEASSTWGVLWEISGEDLAALDHWEANYDRFDVAAANGSSAITAFTYRVKADRVSPIGGAPDPAYLSHLLNGARENGLPSDYVAQLTSYGIRDT
jgi:hypothetical protein